MEDTVLVTILVFVITTEVPITVDIEVGIVIGVIGIIDVEHISLRQMEEMEIVGIGTNL